MKIIEPKAELWIQNDPIDHVARCAHVCYQSPDKGHEANVKFYNALISSNHVSMLRHESCYFKVTDAMNAVMYYEIDCSPYADIASIPNDTQMDYYVATNANFLLDNKKIAEFLEPYRITPEEFKKVCPELMRYTFCLTTQISTSRELNRVSPNNIAEMSTRYIKFGGKVEPSIVRPWWLTGRPVEIWNSVGAATEKTLHYLGACRYAFKCYGELIKEGYRPEDARGVLPLDTATKVIYTYSMSQWRNIINLRYFGTTGKPHGNAKVIIGMVKDELEKLGYKFEQA